MTMTFKCTMIVLLVSRILEPLLGFILHTKPFLQAFMHKLIFSLWFRVFGRPHLSKKEGEKKLISNIQAIACDQFCTCIINGQDHHRQVSPRVREVKMNLHDQSASFSLTNNQAGIIGQIPRRMQVPWGNMKILHANSSGLGQSI